MTRDKILNITYINDSQVHLETFNGIILFDLSMTIDGIIFKNTSEMIDYVNGV